MKKILVTVVLGVAALVAAQIAAQPAQGQASTPPAQGAQPAQSQPAAPAPAAQPAQSQPAAPAASQGPVIKDPAEYNAYVAATQQKDPVAEISGLEAFLTQYPNSIMKAQALDILMALYQQTNNPKVMDAAQRVLAVNPDSVKALVVLAYSERAAQKWADAKQHAEHAVDLLPKWTKPDGVSDADFTKQKTQFTFIMEAVAGFSALNLKDYPAAQKHLRAAVEADPNNVENVYALATALLPPSTPPDEVNGLFFIARAVNLVTDPTGKEQVRKFGHSRYVHYHGGEDGWTDLLAQTASTPLPPAGFTIKPAPTPAEQAHAMVVATDPTKMDFGQLEFILSNGSKEDQDLVWNAIKGKALVLQGTVIKATASEFDIAGSLDDIDAKQADITLTFEAPIPKSLIPKEGATQDFQGEPASYTSSPFMMTMEKGLLPKPKVAPKPTVHHKPTSN
jgi:tetratricopeptide (TPR) repeat protein